MIIILYQILYIILLPIIFVFTGIICIFRKNKKQRFLNRFGLAIAKNTYKTEKTIWVHCLSLGEVNSARKFINSIIKDNFFVYISTTTYTGYKALKKLFGGNKTICFYTPYDFFPIINSVIKKIKPKAFIIIEWDIWPLTLYLIHKKNIPLFLINARLGEAGTKYQKMRCFFKKIFSSFKLIISQTEGEYKLIKSLSDNNNTVEGGNIKYDVDVKVPKNPNELGLQYNKNMLDAPIICAASTHIPEEEMLLRVYKELSKKISLKLIIAPRRPETCKKISEYYKKNNLKHNLRSEGIWKENILIIDTIGELLSFYKISDIVVMGGSFNKKIQGHNIIEPASLGKTVVVGPYMGNFKSIFKEFKNNNAIYLSSEDNLKDDILRLLNDKKLRFEIANNGLSLIERNKGESKKSWNKIKQILN